MKRQDGRLSCGVVGKVIREEIVTVDLMAGQEFLEFFFELVTIRPVCVIS